MCNREFYSEASNIKYCSDECRRENHNQNMRDYRLRVSKKTKEEDTGLRLERKKERDKQYQELLKKKRDELEDRLKERDPKAIMQIANNSSLEYWQAYKQEFLDNKYNKNYIRYVNDISVYDNEFAIRVVESIKELGYISTDLKRIKQHEEVYRLPE